MSALMDAMTQNVIASMDPMQSVMKSLVQQQVKSSELQLDEARIETMIRLQKLIDDGKANGSDGNVIAAYQRMLDKYTK